MFVCTLAASLKPIFWWLDYECFIILCQPKITEYFLETIAIDIYYTHMLPEHWLNIISDSQIIIFYFLQTLLLLLKKKYFKQMYKQFWKSSFWQKKKDDKWSYQCTVVSSLSIHRLGAGDVQWAFPNCTIEKLGHQPISANC